MEFKLLAGCDDGNCPQILLETAEGTPMGIVKGYKLTSEQRAALDIPDGEDAVAVPLPVLIDGGREAERL